MPTLAKNARVGQPMFFQFNKNASRYRHTPPFQSGGLLFVDQHGSHKQSFGA
jgi:hypothetical protein